MNKLRAATPWAAEQLERWSPEQRAAVEREIPEGFSVAFSGRPPNVAAWLLDPKEHRVANILREPSQWSAAWGVLSAYRHQVTRATDA